MALPVLVFDVNETLSDLRPLEARFEELTGSAEACHTWFASALRDGFALSVADTRPAFAEVAREAARVQLSRTVPADALDEAADRVMADFLALSVHPDVAGGVRRLVAEGFRLVTLSNGAASVAEALLDRAGLRQEFERVLSVEDAFAWKPASAAYAYAAAQCEVAPWDMVLVACHPWDVDGAIRAGMRAVWVNRSTTAYPASFTAPTATVATLEELVDVLSEH
jgi:2-haloacid dehalogenase